MQAWESFIIELRNLEALCKVKERLARYWYTCIEGTAFEPHAQKIRHGVKGSLF